MQNIEICNVLSNIKNKDKEKIHIESDKNFLWGIRHDNYPKDNYFITGQ